MTRDDQYSELSAALGCDPMDSHESRVDKARRMQMVQRGVGRRPPKRATTPIGYAVHVLGTSAVFDDSVTQVLVDDDAAGPYILLRQLGCEANKAGEVRLDMDDLEAVVRAARRLIRAQRWMSWA